jgi:hypothetical protein
MHTASSFSKSNARMQATYKRDVYTFTLVSSYLFYSLSNVVFPRKVTGHPRQHNYIVLRMRSGFIKYYQ